MLCVRRRLGFALVLCPLVLAVPCTPAAAASEYVPLTNERLRQVARAEGVDRDPSGKPYEGRELNRRIGYAFQDFVLRTIGLHENHRSFPSQRRAQATRELARPAKSVEPDAVRDVMEYVDIAGPQWIPHPNASFFEVKATRSPLRLSSANHQILGLLDALSFVPFESATGARRSLTVVTTVDTIINSDVTIEAARLGIALWQIVAYELRGTHELCLGSARLLNREVYVSTLSVTELFSRGGPVYAGPGPSGFSRPGRLRAHLPASTYSEPTEAE